MTQQKTNEIILKTAFFITFLVGILSTAQAQRERINLWDNGIPGAKENAGYTEDRQLENGRLVGVSKVTVPELTVFNPEKPNGTAVVICPGGGYGFLAIDKEGFKVAEWFNKNGVTAFVLKYRLPSDLIMQDKAVGPLQDAQRAIRLVRENAKKYNIDTAKVGIMGFSAGGHLASTLSTHYSDEVYNVEHKISARPGFSILLYPVVSMQEGTTHQGSRENLLGSDPKSSQVERFSNAAQITSQTPPAFLVHAADDNVVPVENSIEYFMALQENNVPAEMHIYENGGHGFGLGTQPTSNNWPEALKSWLKSHSLIDAD